jgi:predicted enzyme related to lactoylglutathione lyase
MMGRKKILLAAGVAAALAASQAQADPAQNTMAPPPAKALTMMGAAVPCTDLDRSLAFYTNGLGMTAGPRMDMATITENPLIFPGGGAYLILIKPKSDDGTIAPRTMLSRIILAVPDVKALADRLKAAGYNLSAPINEETKFHVVVGMLQDPDGNHLELVQRTP